MSIKTLRKRIALVAVSALGFGLLTSVAATAAAGFGTVSAGTGGGSICARTTTAGVAANDATVTRVTTTLGSELSFADTGTETSYVVLTGGGFIVDTVTGSGSVSANGLNTTMDATDTAVRINFNKTGTYKVVMYTSSSDLTALDSITVTVIDGACASATWSDAYSVVEIDTAADASPDATESDFAYIDEDIAEGAFNGNDAYNSALPSGVWSISATNNYLVDIGTSAKTAAGTLSEASVTAAGTLIYFSVAQGTTGTAGSTTVTIKYNGTSVWSKLITWSGDAASITVSGVDVQNSTSGGLTGLYDVVVKDAAGNQLAWVVSPDTSYYTRDVTSVTGGTTSASLPTLSAATWTCRTGFTGSVPVRLKATTNALTTIYSNVFNAKCGGAAWTFTAALDKAVYAPGELATLTITAKDMAGGAPFKNETVAETGDPAIAGAQMTPISTPSSGDVFDADGKKTYKFSVGSTEGSYNMAVDLGYDTDSVSVPYTIKATTATVTNTEVLAAIVKLIASINKQIRALQKQLRR